MDLSFPPEDEAFRLELRAWLEQHLPRDLTRDGSAHADSPERLAKERAWQRSLHAAGYLGLMWPVEYGGQGAGITRQVIFQEELARARAPRLPGVMGLDIVGPTIIAYGSEEQKRRYLPPILTAGETWCQGFSEPNAGSDLASLQTRADLDGDEWVINGSKIWNSGARTSDFCALLCRTDQNAPKHRGISYLIVPLRSEGITIQGIRQMDGSNEFNQIFFDNVRVARENLIGEINRGWYIAQNTLGFERGPNSLSLYINYKQDFDRMLGMARDLDRYGRPALADPNIRQDIARSYIDLEILRLHGWRALSNIMQGDLPGADISPAKVHWGLTAQRFYDLVMGLQGPHAQLVRPDPPDGLGDAALNQSYLFSRATTIFGGTGQIQRNIIAERLLGMPR